MKKAGGRGISFFALKKREGGVALGGGDDERIVIWECHEITSACYAFLCSRMDECL